MAEQQVIDKRVYGGYDPELAAPTQPQQGATEFPARKEVPIGTSVVGTRAHAMGEVAEQSAAARTFANPVESFGAAMTESSVAHLYEYATMPTFPVDPTYNYAEDIGSVPFALDAAQEKFLQSSSAEEFDYKLARLEEQNQAYRAMGDSPSGMILGAVLDPGYLALTALTGGAATVARVVGVGAGAQRIAGGAAVAAAAYGMGKAEQKVVPLSDAHVVANAMFFGAAEALLFRNGKMVRADPEAPAERLNQLADEMARRDDPIPMTPDHPDFVGPVPHHPDNLTRPAVAPKGDGAVPVTYERGASRSDLDLSHEYDPLIPLGRTEQGALYKDGVTYVRTADQIAGHVESVRLGRTRIDPEAKAVYLPEADRVFIIRDNIKPTDDLKGILLHEVGVHMNAERVLGTQRFGQMLGRLEELALSGNARARQAFESVPKNTPLHLVREEALGYYIERNHRLVGDSIVGKVVHGVREMLRRVGLKGLKLTENDITQLVRKAAKAKRPGSFDTAFPYVWHGSPVKGIEQLDSAYMGTGEGRQAFGWGHYLSSEKGTALDYRNKEALKRGMAPDDGGLYRVKINAKEHQFLDLDGKVQSATVQSALDSLGVPAGLTGKQAYAHLSKALGGDKAASEALYANGVAGNKYATGRTRGSDIRNSNYVVFHNDSVDMAARYSMGANAAAVGSEPATLAQRVGKNLSWSLHKTISSFGETGKRIADMLVDDPLRMGGDSVVSQHRAIRADLAHLQFKFEDAVQRRMAELGFGTRKQITNPTEAMAAQRGIEREVYLELMRRNALSQEGKQILHDGIPPHVREMADAWDATMAATLSELKRSGATGAAQIAEHAGYVSRRWDNVRIESAQAKMVAAGMTEAEAKQAMQDSLSIGLQRANGWDADLASDIAKAMLDRARRKSYFEDSALRRSAGEDTIAEVRDYLTSAGVSGQRLERALQIMTGKADEAGKAPALKHRVQVALDEPIGQTGMQLVDVLDTSLVTIGERYLDNMAATAAFARKGLTKPSDIATLRKGLLESIPSEAKRREAAYMFDNTIAALRGEPVGEDMGKFLRMSRGLTQMVGLSRAGLFQLTEFAPIMAEHGFAATAREMMRELPVLRTILADPKEASHLRNVLARNSSEDIRLRPFLHRTEDGFAIEHSAAAEMSIMQAKQLVPYLNGLKYVQSYQARVSANLAVNTFERAAKGDLKALAALEHYGLESHIMNHVRSDIAAHGMDTVKWADSTWDAVRGPLTKMMDEAVLRSRTGEIPAFAQFSTTGKFIFTFRSFVLGAHNKVMAGTLNRKGFSGLGLILTYQLPMMYAMAQASNAMSGKPELTEKQAWAQALGQAGALGLLSEAVGIATGEKQQFGAPGLIAVDRGYKLLSSAATAARKEASGEDGNWSKVGGSAYSATPLLSVIPVLKSIPEQLNKSNE